MNQNIDNGNKFNHATDKKDLINFSSAFGF